MTDFDSGLNRLPLLPPAPFVNVAAVGIAAGVAGGAMLTRYLEQMLFDLTPLDPAVFIAVPVVLASAGANRSGRLLMMSQVPRPPSDCPVR